MPVSRGRASVSCPSPDCLQASPSCEPRTAVISWGSSVTLPPALCPSVSPSLCPQACPQPCPHTHSLETRAGCFFSYKASKAIFVSDSGTLREVTCRSSGNLVTHMDIHTRSHHTCTLANHTSLLSDSQARAHSRDCGPGPSSLVRRVMAESACVVLTSALTPGPVLTVVCFVPPGAARSPADSCGLFGPCCCRGGRVASPGK